MGKVKGWSIGRLWFAVLAMALLMGMKAHALVTTTDLELNKWTTNSLNNGGDVDYHRITLKSAGTLTVSYKAKSLDAAYVQLVNEDLKEEDWGFKEGVYLAKNYPDSLTRKVILEPGTYYIRIGGYDKNRTGIYQLMAGFVAAGNLDKEPNNLFEKATTLPANTETLGLISANDAVDIFKFSVPSKQEVTVSLQSMISASGYSAGALVSVWNGKRVMISNNGKKVQLASGTERNPRLWTWKETLAAGTYYFMIQPYQKALFTGKYRVLWTGTQMTEEPETEQIPVSKISFKGTTIAVTGKYTVEPVIKPGTASNQSLKWTTSDKSIATVSKKGVVKGIAPGKATITATAKDGSKVSCSKTFYVKPKRMPAPTVTSEKAKRATVTWDAVPGASGYQVCYSRRSSFSTSSQYTVKKTKTSKVLKLKSGKTYYVRIRAYVKIGSRIEYGKWSKKTKITAM